MNKDEWIEYVHGLPCVVHWLHTGAKVHGVEVHHLQSVRDESSPWLVIPVCSDCHRGPNGIHGLSRRGFYTRYNLDDLSLIAATLKLAAGRDFK